MNAFEKVALTVDTDNIFNEVLPVQQKGWMELEFNSPLSYNQSVRIFIDSSMLSIANILKNSNNFKIVVQALTNFTMIYNIHIDARLTGYTDDMNFKLEGAAKENPNIGIIAYMDRGLLNVLAEYK